MTESTASPERPDDGRRLGPKRRVSAAAARAWYRRAQVPLLTTGVFLVLSTALWLNAAVNRYRFNVALAVVGSVPLAVLLIRAAATARRAAVAR